MPHYKDTQNKLHWLDSAEHESYLPAGLVQITNEEAQIIQSAVQAEFVASLTYAEKRASEYPPMTDYLDGVVKGDQAQIDKYITACLAVKTKYPK